MIDYSKSKLYKVTSTETDEVFIGSTTTTLQSRFSRHLKSLADGEKNTLTKAMKKFGCSTFKISQLETYKAESKRDLREREAYWRNKLGAKPITHRGLQEHPSEKKEETQQPTTHVKQLIDDEFVKSLLSNSKKFDVIILKCRD